MWVWFFMLLCIVVARFMVPDALGEKKKNLIFLAITFGVIVFFSGSRCPIYNMYNGDLYDYFYFYKAAINMPFSQYMETFSFEIGYRLLNEILAWLVPWPYFIIYFESAFCTGVMLWYIYRNSDNAFLSVIFYICTGPWGFFLTGFRQSFAVCFCIIALEMMKKRKWYWDLGAGLMVLLAVSFHSTALVFFLTFIIRYIKLNKKVIVTAFALTAVSTLFIEDVLIFFNELWDKGYENMYKGNALGGIVPIAIYTMALLLCYYVWEHDHRSMDNMQLEITMLFIGMCIYFLRYQAIILERISIFFTPVVSVVLTNGVSRIKNKTTRNILFVLACGLGIALFIYRNEYQDGRYYFFWEYLENRITY